MKKILFVFVFLGLLVGCRSSNTDVTPKTNVELLAGTSSKKWKVTDGTVLYSGLTVNLVSNQPPCVTDNILTLFADKTYELSEGAVKCNMTDPSVIVKSTWSLEESPLKISINKFIFLDYVIDNPVFTIKTIDEKQFTGETLVKYNGNNYVATITFTAQ